MFRAGDFERFKESRRAEVWDALLRRDNQLGGVKFEGGRARICWCLLPSSTWGSDGRTRGSAGGEMRASEDGPDAGWSRSSPTGSASRPLTASRARHDWRCFSGAWRPSLRDVVGFAIRVVSDDGGLDFFPSRGRTSSPCASSCASRRSVVSIGRLLATNKSRRRSRCSTTIESVVGDPRGRGNSRRTSSRRVVVP